MKLLDRVLLLSLFGGYTIKAAVLGASLADAIVIVGLGAAHFLYNFYIQSKEISDLKAGFNKELQALKQIQLDQGAVLSELRSNITGMKLSQSIKKAF